MRAITLAVLFSVNPEILSNFLQFCTKMSRKFRLPNRFRSNSVWRSYFLVWIYFGTIQAHGMVGKRKINAVNISQAVPAHPYGKVGWR
jgi:hypothetical protein